MDKKKNRHVSGKSTLSIQVEVIDTHQTAIVSVRNKATQMVSSGVAMSAQDLMAEGDEDDFSRLTQAATAVVAQDTLVHFTHTSLGALMCL